MKQLQIIFHPSFYSHCKISIIWTENNSYSFVVVKKKKILSFWYNRKFAYKRKSNLGLQ